MRPLTAQKRLFIEASPEAVWKVHTDIAAWSQWLRSISSARADGPFTAGSSFTWKSGGLTISSTVQILEPNQRISWTGQSLGTLANHTWTLRAENGGTLMITEESMEGWLVSLLRFLTPMFLDRSLDIWLHALRDKVEAAKTQGVAPA